MRRGADPSPQSCYFTLALLPPQTRLKAVGSPHWVALEDGTGPRGPARRLPWRGAAVTHCGIRVLTGLENRENQPGLGPVRKINSKECCSYLAGDAEALREAPRSADGWAGSGWIALRAVLRAVLRVGLTPRARARAAPSWAACTPHASPRARADGTPVGARRVPAASALQPAGSA